MSQKDSATAFLRLVVERRIAEAYERFVAPGFIRHNIHFKAMEDAGRQYPEMVLESWSSGTWASRSPRARPTRTGRSSAG
jgi:hypothetical protein